MVWFCYIFEEFTTAVVITFDMIDYFGMINMT